MGSLLSLPSAERNTVYPYETKRMPAMSLLLTKTVPFVLFAIHVVSPVAAKVSIESSPVTAFLPTTCLRARKNPLIDGRNGVVDRSSKVESGGELEPAISYEIADNQKLLLGIYSRVGSEPKRPQKVNQDAYFHACFRSEKSNDSVFTCVGVLDGHGLKGHIVSKFLAQQLPLQLQHQLGIYRGEKFHMVQQGVSSNDDAILVEPTNEDFNKLEQQLHQLGGLRQEELLSSDTSPTHHALTKAFHAAHLAALQDKSIPAGRNGATCVLILLDHLRGELYTANVGDSRAIKVATKNKTGASKEGSKAYQVTPITTETTVKLQNEHDRIDQGEGYIAGKNVFYGPVGIAMTRVLGDAVMLRAGIVPTPVIKTFHHLEPLECIILATDGIWDVMSNDDVSHIMLEYRKEDVHSACNTIAREARRKWIGDLPIVDEETIDDITCVVAALN